MIITKSWTFKAQSSRITKKKKKQLKPNLPRIQSLNEVGMIIYSNIFRSYRMIIRGKKITNSILPRSEIRR